MNKSRPSMKRTIQHNNGQHISDDEWKAIRQSAILVACTFLDPLDPQGILSAGQPHKNFFYKNNFRNEWNHALSELEVVTPLTSFCAGTWKADLTLGSVLQDTTLSKNPAPGPPLCSSTPSSLAPSCVHSTSSHMPPPPLFPPVPGLPMLLLLPARERRLWVQHLSPIASSCCCSVACTFRIATSQFGPLISAGSKSKHRCNPSPPPQRKQKRRGQSDAQSSSSPGMC